MSMFLCFCDHVVDHVFLRSLTFCVFCLYYVVKVCVLCFLISSMLNAETNEMVAVKKIANAFDNYMDAKRTLREIKLLRHLDHENVSCFFCSMILFLVVDLCRIVELFVRTNLIMIDYMFFKEVLRLARLLRASEVVCVIIYQLPYQSLSYDFYPTMVSSSPLTSF